MGRIVSQRVPALVAAAFLAVSVAPRAGATNVISNGSFDEGLAGWTAGTRPSASTDGGAPALYAPSGWTVADTPQASGGVVLPPINNRTAFSSFEGAPAGLELFLAQPFAVNNWLHNAQLVFTYDIAGLGGTGPNDPPLSRRFDVVITDPAGHEQGSAFHYEVPVAGDQNPRQTVSLDIRSLINSLGPGSYRLEFRLTAPEANAGPALFSLDDVSLDLVGNQSPTAICPANQQIERQGLKTPVTLTGSGSDPEGDPLSFQWLQGGALLSTDPVLNIDLPLGQYLFTLIVTDGFGGSSSCDVTVEVVDTRLPTITCPADQTATGAPPGGLVVNYPAPTVSGGIGTVTVTCNPASGTTFPIGTTTVTCTATDTAGNAATCTFKVTVVAALPLAITCPANLTRGTDPGHCSAVVNYPAPTTAGGVGTVSVVCDPPSGATFPKGTIPVTCTATDAADHQVTCTFTVTVTDTEKPQITCPANLSTGTEPGKCSAVVSYPTPTATDNCGTANVVCDPPAGATFPKGTTTVTCTATDAAGNSSTCTFTVKVNDTEKPTLSCPANLSTGTDPGKCSAVVNYPAPTASDNCGVATLVCDPPSGSTFAKGSTTVTCTATDAAGNSATCTFTVTVNDTEKPTLSCPADQTVTGTPPGGLVVNYPAPTAGDNCGVATLVCDPPAGATFPIGTTRVSCTATDTAGNSSTCTFTVAVVAAGALVITCPANLTRGTDPGKCSAVVSYPTPTASGGVGTPSVVCDPPSGATFAKGTTTVTCTATDAANQQVICTFTVTVNDTEKPTLSCPANLSRGTEPGKCSAVVNYPAPTAGDNCGVASLVCDPPSGSTFAKGTTTVTCTATDAAGNSSTCTFTVSVNDTEKPTITCPADQTATGAPPGGLVVNYPAPTASDNCGTPSVTCDPPSGTTFPVGTTTVTCTATDAAGNSSTCTFKVTVVAAPPLTITCPANLTRGTDPGKCSAVVSYSTPTTTGGVGTVTVVCNPPSGATFAKGTTTVTCTATDAANQQVSCTFTITVNDTEKPTLSCPANLTQGTDPGKCSAVVNYSAPTAGDNCGVASLVCAPPSGATFAKGTTTVTCTATDAAGNSATCTFTVTVNDTEKPAITCPANISTGTDPGKCTAVVSYATPTTSDNCGTPTLVCNPPSGTPFAKGATTVTCTATDAAGNTSTCTFTVTVNDTEKPQITCPANISTGTDPGKCTAVVNYPAPTASDNCGTPSLVCNPPSGATFAKGTTTVTCTATDAAGNSSTCTFTVTVSDTQKPTVTCFGDLQSKVGPASCTTWTPSDDEVTMLLGATAVDNCDGSVPATFLSRSDGKALGDPFPVGTTTITWRAVDSAGNVGTCSQHVQVTAPRSWQLVCPGTFTVWVGPNDTSGPLILPTAITGEHCDVQIVCSPAKGTPLAVGSTTNVVCTATDPNGETRQCTTTVTVARDTTPPQLQCPTHIVRPAFFSDGSALVDYGVTATDESGVVTITCNPEFGHLFPLGDTQVTCTAMDRFGNTSTCTFTVTIIP